MWFNAKIKKIMKIGLMGEIVAENNSDNHVSGKGVSGLWSGKYWYSKSCMQIPSTVAFSAHFLEEQEVVSGITLEPNTFVLSEFAELAGDIDGKRKGDQISFDKHFNEIPGLSDYEVCYSGVIEENDTRITGTWNVTTESILLDGGFELARVSTALKLQKNTSIEL